MRKQAYLIKKGARYHVRRRLPSYDNDNSALTLYLHTADSDEARRLARRLAVRWDEIAMIEGHNIERANLPVAEIQAIFRAGLEEKLAIAASDLAAPRKFRETGPGSGELFVAAYETIRQVCADADYMPSKVLDRIAHGWPQKDRSALETLLEVFVRPDDIKKTRIIAGLEQIGAPISESTKHEALCFAGCPLVLRPRGHYW